MTEPRIEQMGRRVLAGERLDRPDCLHLACLGDEQLDELLFWANQVRCAHFGDQVKFCSIAAGKIGSCGEDCKWCAQSARYATAVPANSARTAAEEIARAANEARQVGACSFGIVNSGRKPSAQDVAALDQALGRMRERGVELLPCASLGELDDPTARQLARIGVRRYNHNLETSRRFFGRMVSTHAYEDRLRTLDAARGAGLSLCCGGIFGLGESPEDRVDLALTLRDRVRPDVTPLNFLHPIVGTPLADATPLTPRQCLHTIAMFRLILPTVDLKIAGGRHVNLRELQSWMFHAGATSCLVGNYLTTIGRDAKIDRQMVEDLGLRLVDQFDFEADASAHNAKRSAQQANTCPTP